MTDTKRLKLIIKESGLKMKYLAEQLNLSVYGLSLKINNVNDFKTKEISKLCEILGINKRECIAIFFAKEVDE